MKIKTLIKMNSMILVAFLAFGMAQAADQTGSHEEHHPDVKAPTKTEGAEMMGKEGMMGQMDMNQMSGMMHKCMEMHKDGEMCEHQSMEQCQAKMGKAECQKIMKDVKKNQKKSKDKKIS